MRIIVTDDDKLVALSLKTILESTGRITVEAMASGGEEAIRLYDELSPDVMLMDIRMEGMTGLEAGEKILATHPDAKLLYLTTFNDDEYIVKALSMGAKGYMLKQDFEGIAAALEAVAGGQSVFGEKIVSRLPELMSRKEEFDFAAHGISDKEREIMEAVASGLSNKEIADVLCISMHTVISHRKNIARKLNIHSTAGLTIYAIVNKLVDLNTLE